MRRLAFVLILLLLTSFTVRAIGSGDGWKVVFFNPTTDGGELVVISDQGLLDPILVPESVFEPLGDYSLSRLAISPDLRFILVTYVPASDPALPALPLRILDLENDTQREIEMSLEHPIVYSFTFNPDGTQIAVAYVGAEDQEAVAQGGDVSGGLMVVDLATGETTAQITLDDIKSAVNNSRMEWALPTAWTDGERVPFVPACFFCNQVAPTRLWTWNPADNTFSEIQQYYFPFGALLPESGEVLVARLNEDYPFGEETPNAYLPPSNVIEYYPADADPSQPGTVVFFDDTRFPLGGAPWVQDGRAFLTRQQGSPEAVLIFRDGSQQTFTLPEGPVIVIGTPDGGIIVDTRGRVHHYRVVGDEVFSERVAQINFSQNYNLNNVVVVYSTPIGASSGGKAFPAVPEPRSTAFNR